MDMSQTRETLKMLERELQILADRLRSGHPATRAEGSAVELPDGDRGTDLFDQVQATESRESAFASRERIVGKLQRVTAAIARVKDGSYGECAECGQPIAPARLRALPEATTCVACQERLERSGLRVAPVRGAQLAEIEALADDEAEAPRVAAEVSPLPTSEVLAGLRESETPLPQERATLPRVAPAARRSSAARTHAGPATPPRQPASGSRSRRNASREVLA
jgi:RNA polymerase-binding transcription factor DksA